MKNWSQQKISRGFIQIPLLLFIVFGAVVVAGGGYYAATYGTTLDVSSNTTTSGDAEVVASTTPEKVEEKATVVEKARPKLSDFRLLQPDEVDEPKIDFVALKAEILGYLEADIRDLSSLQKNVAEDRERWIAFSENAANQRAVSLETLVSRVSNTEIRSYIEKTAKHYWEEKKEARASLTELYEGLGAAIDERLEKTVSVRNEVAKGLAPEGFEDLLLGNEKEIQRFINLAIKVNEVAYSVETMKSDGFSSDLGYIRSLLSTYGSLITTNQQLSQLEAEATKTTVPKSEFRCWATTDYEGGINGTSKTSIRCE